MAASGLNVLLVDDDTTVLRVHGEMMRMMGHAATMFSNSEQALEYLTRHSSDIDMVITDFAMPRLNGLQLLQEIRRMTSDLPVVMITGYADGEDLMEVGALGAEVLGKPVRLEQLETAIDRVREARQ